MDFKRKDTIKHEQISKLVQLCQYYFDNVKRCHVAGEHIILYCNDDFLGDKLHWLDVFINYLLPAIYENETDRTVAAITSSYLIYYHTFYNNPKSSIIDILYDKMKVEQNVR